MSLRARTFLCAALAAGLALGCADASAAPASAPTDAVTVHANDPKPPQVLPGIRPGGHRLQCHKHDARLDGVFDFGRPSGSAVAYRTPAQTVRRFLAFERTNKNLQGLRYERRTPPLRPDATKADARRQALFVGLRRDGTVKAAISLDRVGSGDSRQWRVGGVDLCVKGNADR